MNNREKRDTILIVLEWVLNETVQLSTRGGDYGVIEDFRDYIQKEIEQLKFSSLDISAPFRAKAKKIVLCRAIWISREAINLIEDPINFGREDLDKVRCTIEKQNQIYGPFTS